MRLLLILAGVGLAFVCATMNNCNVAIDSSDPRSGLVRAGADIRCAPLAPTNDTLGGCAASCCDEPGCVSFSWNAPWVLPPPAYMGCEIGRNCCCLKNAAPPLESNKWPMNITTGVVQRPFRCTTNLDCSLNGICNHSACACDPGWKGANCEQLDLLPVEGTIKPAYPPPALEANTTSWGGSVIRDATTNDYHMYVAEMENSCGMTTWSTNSVIRHAVAAKPVGPFQSREVVMPAFAHNPTVVRAPDGTYLIYHIGCGTPNQGVMPCTNCSNGLSGTSCHGPGEQVACDHNTTNILYSDSLEGPWEQLNAPFIKSDVMGTPYQIDNPTVVFFSNGSLLMLGRGGDLRREASSDGVITASSWRGPYIMHAAVGNAMSPDVEDPFVWRDFRGNFHALFHKFTDEHPSCGGHAFSRDGFNWTLTNTAAYETVVRTTANSSVAFNRRERPHLLFSNEEGEVPRPIVLYTTLTNWSSSGANEGHDSAFTFAQRINS